MKQTEINEIFDGAANDTLPPDFDWLDVDDECGWILAHEDARYGHLPDEFRLWSMVDNLGNTVRNVADQRLADDCIS